MLQQWGTIIEKHPWFVVITILIITIGFSTLLPNIQFKTDFSDFSPEDELVRANNRVMRNFGLFTQLVLLVVNTQQAESTITPQALREQHAIQQALLEKSEVTSTFSITTYIDAICQLEFGQSFDNCTDAQIQIALEDLLSTPSTEPLIFLANDDNNEPVEYQKFPYLSGKQINSLDIKNGYLKNTSDTYKFTIEVYDLSQYAQTNKPKIPQTNIVEWYINFNNLIIPDELLDIDYQIAARIEPTNPLWEFGKGLRTNTQDLIQKIRSRTLFNTYTQEAYLWIRPNGQTIYFPTPLHNANITLDITENTITIEVSKAELSLYGIAPQFGSFQLPAKLSNFSLGSRYYTHPGILRKGGRLVYNTDFLLNRLDRIRQRTILGPLVERLLQRTSGITWDDFDQLFNLIEETNALPDTFAAQDLQSLWTHIDQTESSAIETTYRVYPSFFEEIQISSLAFLSKDYTTTHKPSQSLIIIETEFSGSYEENIRRNKMLVKEIEMLDEKNNAVSMQVTGEGVISSEINEITSAANTIIGPSIFIIIFGILLLNFRRLSYVLLAMLALSIATIWLFGTMVLLGIDFNVIAVALTPLILGLGVDYAVHLFHNYRTEIENGRKPSEAIRYSVQDIGTAMFLAMITTVIAFMSFLSSNIGPVRDFGTLLALGVIYTFITSITILAALRYIIDKRKTTVITRKKKIYSVRTIMGTLAQAIIAHQKKILFSIVIITIILSTGATQINTGFDLNEFLPQDTPALELYEEVANEFPSSSQAQEYIFIEGNVATVAVLKGMAITHEKFKDDTYVNKNPDGTMNTVSIYSVIQQSIKNNQSLIPEFNIDPENGIPNTNEDVLALYDYLYGEKTSTTDTSESFSIDDFNYEAQSVLYKTENGYEAALIRIYIDPTLQTKEGNINEDLEILQNELKADVADYGNTDVTVTGNLLVTLRITNSLTESQILSTGISLLLAALVLIIAYRSPTLGLIAMIPVGFSIIWILGTMYFIGYSLNVLTITVTSITIGIGIDYAIHATERFRLVADKTGDPELAVCETISHTGGALFIAALTTTMGFGILVFAPIPPQQQFGLIIAITIAFSFLTSVLILPLALSKWAKSRKKRKGYIITPYKSNNNHIKLNCKPPPKRKS
jgi:hydrophobe/amphiphile efflux-3 (HAE3) family protein